MRNVVVAAVAGGVAGAVLGWVVARSSEARPAEGSADLAVAATALERASRALEEAARRSPALSSDVGIRPEPRAPVPADEPSARPPDAPAREPAPPRERPRVADRRELPAADREAVKGLASWLAEERADEQGEEARKSGVRRRWLFATEAEVLEAFGSPDAVGLHDNGERWEYWMFEDREQKPSVVLWFRDGRLRKVGY